MLTAEQNDLLCKTGPGTPCGDMLRRYWQPVGLSSGLEAAGKPRQVKVMGEDLVLFRDDKGRPGLLGLYCSHRLTSLAYGRVEDGGIRCPFHGWLYDVAGRCLAQPAEPEPFAEKIRHLSYPCQELGGLIFAYMGPSGRMPLLPRYEVLVRQDGSRKVDCYPINSNYLQNVEGALDTVHSPYLHMAHWSKMKPYLFSMAKPRTEFAETDFGIWQKSYLPTPDPVRPHMREMYGHFFMPAGFIRIQASPRNKNLVQKYQSWYVPMDDTHTMRFQASFSPQEAEGKLFEWPKDLPYEQPGPDNDYYRTYESADTLSGIPTRTVASPVKGFLVQDSMANETQGPVVERGREHLGAHDKVLTAMRVMCLLAIESIRKGEDPKHIVRDPAKNEVVYIRGTEELELF